MFVSHDKNIPMKKFQKPNILRRKSKNSFYIQSSKDKSLFSTFAIESDVYERKTNNNKPLCSVSKVVTSPNSENILKEVCRKNNEIMHVNLPKIRQETPSLHGQDLLETVLQSK